jgi:PTS system nitrogen regulatory IIA component
MRRKQRAPLLTLADVAFFLQVGERTVYLWAQKGLIPSFKLGNVWRFRRSELDACIAARVATWGVPCTVLA